MNQRPIANYTTEETLFTELIQNNSERKILLFQGASGSGKSHLIEHCLSTAPDTPSVLLRGGESIPTLFTNMGMKQGWPQLPNFTRFVANLQEQPGQENDSAWQMGMHRHLREIGQISDLESRFSRYQLLADAWFADALAFEKPFLLAVDTYEKASSLFKRWFGQEFLYGVANASQMRVLVGGQSVPTVQEGWGFYASLQELKGIHEAKEWLAWAEEVGYQVPSLEVLAGVVLALKGNPSQIIEVIKTEFPRSNGPIKPKESLYEQRKRFFDNMTASFSLSELKNFCFFLGIDYENLPDHDHKGGFVRELLGYVGRIGRLQELIQVCQAERPQLEW